eukprot:6704041-Pyramimonas_sp.AAC.1
MAACRGGGPGRVGQVGGRSTPMITTAGTWLAEPLGTPSVPGCARQSHRRPPQLLLMGPSSTCAAWALRAG